MCLEMPYAGARKISRELKRRTGGRIGIGRRATASIMGEMNVRPLYPKPNLSKPAKAALKHPYLLKNKAIRFPNEAWAWTSPTSRSGGPTCTWPA